MICGNCGKENPDGTLFCISCGQQLASNHDGSMPSLIKDSTAQPAASPNDSRPNYNTWRGPSDKNGVPLDYYEFAPKDNKGMFVLAIVGVVLSILFLNLPGLICCIVALVKNQMDKSKGIKSSYYTKTLVIGIIGILVNLAIALFMVVSIIAYDDDASENDDSSSTPAIVQESGSSSSSKSSTSSGSASEATAPSASGNASGSHSVANEIAFAEVQELPNGPKIVADDDIANIQITAKAVDSSGYVGYRFLITNKSDKDILFVSNPNFAINGSVKNVVLSQYVESGETSGAFLWVDPDEYDEGIEGLASANGTIDAISGDSFKAIATYRISLG